MVRGRCGAWVTGKRKLNLTCAFPPYPSLLTRKPDEKRPAVARAVSALGGQLDVLMVSDSTVSPHEEAASNRESREAGRVANS